MQKAKGNHPFLKKSTTPTVLCAFQEISPKVPYDRSKEELFWSKPPPQPGRRCVGGVTCENWKHVAVVFGFCWHLFFFTPLLFFLLVDIYMVESCGLFGSGWLVFFCEKNLTLLKIWRLSFWNWNINKRSPKCMGETICQKDHLAKRARQPAGRACGWFLAGYPLWKEPIFWGHDKTNGSGKDIFNSESM